MSGPPLSFAIHMLALVLVPAAVGWWKFHAGNAARMKRALRRGAIALRAWFPGKTDGLFTVWTERIQAPTAELFVRVAGEFAGRARGFSFDLDVPVEAMRELRPADRRAVCASLIGAPTAENFTTFLRGHIRRESGATSGNDCDMLAMMQGVVWAECYAAGWPVLCPTVRFTDGPIARFEA